MALPFHQQPKEVLQSWIDAILDEASDKLNDWEIKFIKDIQIRVSNGWHLSEKQQDTLEIIYAEKTS